MNIRIKETLNIRVDGMEHVVRSGTIGVEKNHIVYFHDTTKSCAVGFPRDLCLENPSVFSVTRNIEDREITMSDILRVVDKVEDPQIRDGLVEAIKAL